MQNETETIAAVRSGSGMDLSRYVERTFRNDVAAFTWRNRQTKHVTILRLSGKFHRGDAVPFGVGEPIEAKYSGR